MNYYPAVRVVEIDFASVPDVARPVSAQPSKLSFVSTLRVVEIEYVSVSPEVVDTSLRITSDGNFRIVEDGTLRSVRV